MTNTEFSNGNTAIFTLSESDLNKSAVSLGINVFEKIMITNTDAQEVDVPQKLSKPG